MPRSRGRAAPARSAPSRPSTAPNRQVTPQQQQPNRAASTAAQPPAGAAKGATSQGAAGQSPGLFGQMASTAAGVAVGSSIGHAIGGMFGGSSTGSGVEAEGQQNDNALAAQAQDGYQNNSWAQQSCEPAALGLRGCLDQNNGNMQICTWYLEQLKSCQAAASQY